MALIGQFGELISQVCSTINFVLFINNSSYGSTLQLVVYWSIQRFTRQLV